MNKILFEKMSVFSERQRSKIIYTSSPDKGLDLVDHVPFDIGNDFEYFYVNVTCQDLVLSTRVWSLHPEMDRKLYNNVGLIGDGMFGLKYV